jgi:hypothetical protein
MRACCSTPKEEFDGVARLDAVARARVLKREQPPEDVGVAVPPSQDVTKAATKALSIGKCSRSAAPSASSRRRKREAGINRPLSILAHVGRDQTIRSTPVQANRVVHGCTTTTR